MKTLNKFKLLLIMSVMVNGLALLAGNGSSTNLGNGPTVKKPVGAAEKTIGDYFRFPQLVLPHLEQAAEKQAVEVVFTTGANGRVNFVQAKTNNARLKAEIEKHFSNLVLPDLKQDVGYSVVLKFKTV